MERDVWTARLLFLDRRYDTEQIDLLQVSGEGLWVLRGCRVCVTAR